MKSTIFLMVLATSVAFAQPHMMGKHRITTQVDRPEGVVKRLDLKDDQLAKFKKYRSQLRRDQIELRAKIQTLRVELRDLFDADKPDKITIESKISEITKLQGEEKLKMVTFWFDVNAMLTPEQQKVWKKVPRMVLHERRGAMMGGHRRGWGMMNRQRLPDNPGDEESPGDNE